MKKNKLVISCILIMFVALFSIVNFSNINIMNDIDNISKEQYNSNPNNILDNVFMQDGKLILPFIFNKPDETVKKQYVIEQFKNKKITIKNEASLPNTIATGTIIKTENKEYNVVIYGDVDGNGRITVYDAQKVYERWKSAKKFSNIVFELAANVNNNNDSITVYDAQKIYEFWARKSNKLVLNPPKSLVELDKQKPIIKLKGDNPQYVNLNEKYIEQGAIVSDNVDENLSIKINSNVNVNKVGNYTVTYTAVDTAGNIATINRKVVVVQKRYVTGIEYISGPEKTQYTENEKISKNGLIVNKCYNTGEKIKINVNDLILSPEKAEHVNDDANQTQKITVSYKVPENEKQALNKEQIVSTEFEISVVNKISDIIVKKVENATIYKYDDYKKIATIQSKKFEEALKLNNVNIFVNDEITNINSAKGVKIDVIPELDGTGKLGIYFKATEVGKYTIVPKVGEITGEPIVINVYEDATITDAEIKELPNTIIKDKEILKSISFYHKYNEDYKVEIENVMAKDMRVETTGLEVKLYDEDGIEIQEPNNSISYVKKILIKGIQNGKGTIKIKSNGKEIFKKEIQIEASNFTMTLGDGSNEITLYNKKTEDDTKVVVDNDLVYTLLKIEIKENGSNIKISENLLETENNLIKLKLFEKGNETYLGIAALLPNEGNLIDVLKELNGKNINIKYGNLSKTLTINTEYGDTTITDAEIKELPNTIIKDKEILKSISFYQKYNENYKVKIENVMAKDIRVETTGLEVKLYDEDGSEIENPDDSNSYVKKISIKGIQNGKGTIKIKSNGKEIFKKEIQIEASNFTMTLGDGSNKITLYNKKQIGNEMVYKESEDDYFVYTLLKIEIKENNQKIELDEEELLKKLSIKNSQDEEDIKDLFKIKLIKKDDLDYLGISVKKYEESDIENALLILETLCQENITIQYGKLEGITFALNVERI